jgi:hypothetical protein
VRDWTQGITENVGNFFLGAPPHSIVELLDQVTNKSALLLCPFHSTTTTDTFAHLIVFAHLLLVGSYSSLVIPLHHYVAIYTFSLTPVSNIVSTIAP